MKAWPDTNGSAIGRYLRQLRLRNPKIPTIYRSILRGFQDVVAQHERSPSRVSRHVLEVWLRERTAEWAASTVLHRACIIDRFLDFLVRDGSIASNPLAEVRISYCVRGSKTILRALLAPQPDRALEAVRQLPPFGSILGDLMRDQIALMRTRGFRYETHAHMFLRFDRFSAAASRARQQTGDGYASALGSHAFDRVPCRRLRAAGARPRQGPASSRSQRRSATPGLAAAAAGRAAVAPALHL
jgi:integrase/recombinase XerD